MSKRHYTITKGLDLPVSGAPEQKLGEGGGVARVGVRGSDYPGLKPTMLVSEGDQVKIGQPLFEDKKNPGVTFTSPACGVVEAVNRGAKRVLESVVVRQEGDDALTFDAPGDPLEADPQAVRDLLIRSGLWTALRTRPFSNVPPVDGAPRAIFVNAMDSNPLAPLPRVAIQRRPAAFRAGLLALTRLTDGPVYLITREGVDIPGVDTEGVTHVTFSGPHPAGLVGTHIHFVDPIVHPTDMVWHAGYQDVVCMGALMTDGVLDTERVVSIGGPAAANPRLVLTRMGASVSELAEGEVGDGSRELRVVSGSLLSGTSAGGDAQVRLGFLGRYDQQVSLLYEGREREFVGWHGLGRDRFSIKNVFVTALNRARKFDFTTSTNGSPRAMVPVGSFERVMPLDVMPTFLLRALLSGDTDTAQALGALELDEEDLGLCTFVCPGKTEYGPLLRETLTTIERDG